MLEYFMHNSSFSRTLATDNRPEVRRQLIAIIKRAHHHGLDWYFTRIPDLRCGRKEIDAEDAEEVYFRILMGSDFRFSPGFGKRIHLEDRNIPLNPGDLRRLYGHIVTSAETNTSTRPVGGFWPDEYIASDARFEFDRQVAKSLSDTCSARLQRLRGAETRPRRYQRLVTVFDRNPDVVAEVLHLAKGKCQRCNKKAPFMKRSNSEPYLEVHHKKWLVKHGEDTVANAIALCPNCHREMHHGPTSEDSVGP